MGRDNLRILFAHDRKLVRRGSVGLLRDFGYQVFACDEVGSCLETLKRINDLDVVVIHKDLRSRLYMKDAGDVLKVVREGISERVRTIVTSGEWPDGSRTVVGWEASSYFPIENLFGILEEIKRGFLAPDEVRLLGRALRMPVTTLEGWTSEKEVETLFVDKEGRFRSKERW